MRAADGTWWTAEQIAELSFEAAQTALEQVVDELEAGDLPLDDALAAFQVGRLLEAHCRAKLAAVEDSIATLTAAADGSPQVGELEEPR